MTIEEARRTVEAASPWLRNAPARFRRALLDRCTLHRYAADDVVHVAGAASAGVNGVVEGRLRVYASAADGQVYLVHLLGPGVWAGEGPALIGEERPVTLIAAKPTTILRLAAADMQSLVARHPDDWTLFMEQTMTHLRVALRCLADAMMRDPKARLAAALQRLTAGPDATVEPVQGRLAAIDISQSDLAEIARIGRTRTSQLLGELEASGAIEIAYRRIRVVNPEKLQAALIAHE